MVFYRLLCVAVVSAMTCFVAGCFSSHPEVHSWNVSDVSPSGESAAAKKTPLFATSRLGAVTVLAPFDARSFTVRRADGSLAYDACNVFLSSPSTTLRAPVLSILNDDGRFGRVLDSVSCASSEAVVELMVTDLSIDCSTGKRVASVALTITVVRTKGRTVMLVGSGSARIDASGTNFSETFSTAFSTAARNALSDLK